MNFIDLTPLRDTRFRFFWSGLTLQSLGNQFTVFAIIFQVWTLTKSTIMTGLVGLVIAIPMIVFALWGGVLADKFNRRSLVLHSIFGSQICAIFLAMQAYYESESLLALYGLGALQAAFNAIGRPARKSFIPILLPRSHIGAGVTLTNASSQMSSLLGPALAGLLSIALGIYGLYLVEVVCLLFALYSMKMLPSSAPVSHIPNQFSSFLEGINLTWRTKALRGSLMTDLCATSLAMPISLFPALNEVTFSGSASTLGLFGSSLAFGGLLATLFSGKLSQTKRPGKLQLKATLSWGISLVLAASLSSHSTCLLFIACAGAADTVAVIARGIIVQNFSEDNTRGRILALDHVIGAAGPELGNFRGGLLASALTPQISLLVGGITCVIGTFAIRKTNEELYNSEISS